MSRIIRESHASATRLHEAGFIDDKRMREFDDLMQSGLDRLAKDRADWLLDAVATATQDRRYLRGDPEADAVAIEAILLNGEKAIRVALRRATGR